MVVDVSDAAAQALAQHGGFAYYDARNRQIWELAKQLRGPGKRRFERLLYERDAALRATLDPQQQTQLRQLQTLLDDPFYQAFQSMCIPRAPSRSAITWRACSTVTRAPRMPST